MELSKLILDGISSVANIDDQSFNRLLNNVFEVTATDKLLKANKCDIKLATDKEAYSSLLCLVVEAAKHNADSASISSTLEECRWDASHISSFVNMFQTHKEKIQTALSMISETHNQIIDVEWRQDFVIKSNNCEKICEPSYIISLKTWNPHSNSSENVPFSCTLEQLEDLVLKLKDATKCIERNAG